MKFLFFLSLFCFTNAKNIENDLKKHLLRNYSPNIRPVLDYHDTVNVSFGVEVTSLEEFNQVSEKVKFNFLMKYMWHDDYLVWNRSDFDLKFINLDPKLVWLPDLELYNSASKPENWLGDGVIKIYNTGLVYWIIPVLYDFSCPLQLNNFPFDQQICKMTMGSWKLNRNFLNISLNDIYYKDTILRRKFPSVSFDKYSHNEWLLDKINFYTDEIEYLCCPDEYWTISHIDIHMHRNYHKYMVVIIMTFFLTLSSIVVASFNVENYTRTFVLVFIPLSVIWLQLYIASKMPVIEYSTTMEKYLLLSFFISIICAIESGIFFNFLNLSKEDVKNENRLFSRNNKYKKNNFYNIWYIKKIEFINKIRYLYPTIRHLTQYIDNVFRISIIIIYVGLTIGLLY
jgi:hypothetical protein